MPEAGAGGITFAEVPKGYASKIGERAVLADWLCPGESVIKHPSEAFC
jgi:hypothetical protein